MIFIPPFLDIFPSFTQFNHVLIKPLSRNSVYHQPDAIIRFLPFHPYIISPISNKLRSMLFNPNNTISCNAKYHLAPCFITEYVEALLFYYWLLQEVNTKLFHTLFKSILSGLFCIYTTPAFNLQLSSLTQVQPLPCLLSICKSLFTVL